MTISNLNPVRLISFGFKAPAPSLARQASTPAAVSAEGAVTRVDDPTRSASDPHPTAMYRPIEPMLLLHQERVRTVQIVLHHISRALQTLKSRSTAV